MCAPYRKRDPRTRRQMAIANLSLAIGLILWVFVRPSLAAPHLWIDAICGMFMGISIGGNLMLVLRARRCRTENL